MTTNLNLSAAERTTIEDTLAKISLRRRKPIHLGNLIGKWGDLVSKIERGYSLSVYDYTNDLTTRDLIEEIETMVPPATRDKIAKAVASLDARFFSATDEVSEPLLSRKGEWWRRIPRRRDPDFDSGLSGANRLHR